MAQSSDKGSDKIDGSASKRQENSNVTAFSSAAESYDKATGGATRHIARQLATISPPLDSNSVILDNACGTGIVIEELQKHLSSISSSVKPQVIAADASAAMIDALQGKLKRAKADDAWPNLQDNVVAHSVPAEELVKDVVASNSITHSYTNFGLFFCKDPTKAAKHIYRTLAPGGTAFITSWHDTGALGPVRKTEGEMQPGNENFKLPFDERWAEPWYVKDVLVQAGFDGDKIEMSQAPSSWSGDDLSSLAQNLTLVFGTLTRGSSGWKSKEEKQEFARRLESNIPDDSHYVLDESGRPGLRMIANIAACTK